LVWIIDSKDLGDDRAAYVENDLLSRESSPGVVFSDGGEEEKGKEVVSASSSSSPSFLSPSSKLRGKNENLLVVG